VEEAALLIRSSDIQLRMTGGMIRQLCHMSLRVTLKFDNWRAPGLGAKARRKVLVLVTWPPDA